jgi:hypothetical protein
VHDVLRSAGQPLDRDTRAFMEPRFGHDFSHVRVHADAAAAESARAVGALAYTVGSHVVFGAGQLAIGTTSGRHLIAHELAHVVEQTGAGATPVVPQRLAVDGEDTPSEHEADRLADRVTAASAATPVPPAAAGRSTPHVSRRTTPVTLQRRVSPRMPTIRTRLKTGWFNSVTDREAHEVLVILKELQALSRVDFNDTVVAMEREGLVARFLSEVSEQDRRNEPELLRRISNARVFVRQRTTPTGTVTTITAGSCSPERFDHIRLSTIRAINVLNRAITLTDGFLGAPAAPAGAVVREAAREHFKSVDPAVIRHVRGRLNQIRTDIRSMNPAAIECHDAWDLTCSNAVAFVDSREPERMTFCTRFFGKPVAVSAGTIIHEMAHAQVGGVHIADRSYSWERMRRFLSLEEALTNAESYEMFASHLNTGRAPAMNLPKDTSEDCPTDWWRLLTVALARAQRASSDAEDATEELTVAKLGRWRPARAALLGGQTQADINRARKVYKETYKKLRSKVDFECETGGGGRCSGAELYWYAIGDLHVCPSWRALRTEGERVRSLLSALYGHFGFEDDGRRRDNYARLAVELMNADGVPTRLEILGSAAWSADRIRIQVTPREPLAPPRTNYFESGIRTDRISDNLPIYFGPEFRSDPVPFRCEVSFMVDTDTEPRPSPFTPPRAVVLFEYDAPGHELRREVRDPRLNYEGAGAGLETTFPSEFSFTLQGDGDLHMRFELADADSGVTRVYDDTIEVVTERITDIPRPGANQVA